MFSSRSRQIAPFPTCNRYWLVLPREHIIGLIFDEDNNAVVNAYHCSGKFWTDWLNIKDKKDLNEFFEFARKKVEYRRWEEMHHIHTRIYTTGRILNKRVYTIEETVDQFIRRNNTAM